MESAPKTAAQAATKLAKSAEVIEDSAEQQTDSADRRTVLAADRTVLAAERTYAAWVRTGLTSLAAGVGARKLLEQTAPDFIASSLATMLVLFSALCFVAAVWRDLYPGAPPPRPDVRRLPAPLLLAANGFLVFVSLVVLVGLWTRLV